MTKAELSRLSGISARTIRFYEDKGFIPPAERLDNGYRNYDSTIIKRLQFIKNAKELGFSLKEIKELSEMKITPGASCRTVQKKAQQKIRKIEARMEELGRIKKALEKFTGLCLPGRSAEECEFLHMLEN